MKRVLVLAWGNPSRGDDAVGPSLVASLEAEAARRPEWSAHAFVTDFQLQPEHALDLDGADLVLFADASAKLPSSIAFTPVHAARDRSFTSHALSPQALLAVHGEVGTRPTPPAWLLAVRGERFELGEPMGAAAEAGLAEALAVATRLLSRPERAFWDRVSARAA